MPVSLSTRTAGATATAAAMNADMDAIEAYTGAIPVADLADGTSGQIIVCNASGVPTYRTPSGPVGISNTGVTTIAYQGYSADNVAINTSGAWLYIATPPAGTYLAIGKAHANGVTSQGWKLTLSKNGGATEYDHQEAASGAALDKSPLTVSAIVTYGGGDTDLSLHGQTVFGTGTCWRIKLNLLRVA